MPKHFVISIGLCKLPFSGKITSWNEILQLLRVAHQNYL